MFNKVIMFEKGFFSFLSNLGASGFQRNYGHLIRIYSIRHDIRMTAINAAKRQSHIILLVNRILNKIRLFFLLKHFFSIFDILSLDGKKINLLKNTIYSVVPDSIYEKLSRDIYTEKNKYAKCRLFS